MGRPRHPALIACLALLVAGCTAPAEPVQAPEPVEALREAAEEALAPALGEPSVAEPPVWRVGDWWRYRLEFGNESSLDTRVVRGESVTHWFVGTTSAETAVHEARFDISSLGRIAKADLSGEQRGQPVRYFEWPLVPNATWQATWDGEQRTVRVVGPAEARVGVETLEGIALEARAGDAVRARYVYAPAARWVTSWEFSGADGTFRMALEAWGSGFNGTLVEARVQELYQERVENSFARPAGTFRVPEGQSYLAWEVALRGEQGGYTIALRDPGGNVTTLPGLVCRPCNATDNGTLAATPGEWRVTAVAGAGGTEEPGVFEFTVLAVELREAPFPPA